MIRHYIDPREKAWVEELDDRVNVSWPGGLRVLSYEDDVGTLLVAIREAVKALMAEKPDSREVTRGKREAFDKGYTQGWDDHQRDTERKAAQGSHPSSSRGGAVRTVDTGTQL